MRYVHWGKVRMQISDRGQRRQLRRVSAGYNSCLASRGIRVWSRQCGVVIWSAGVHQAEAGSVAAKKNTGYYSQHEQKMQTWRRHGRRGDLWDGRSRRAEPSRGHSRLRMGGEDLKQRPNMFRMNEHLIRWHIDALKLRQIICKSLMTVMTGVYLRRLGTG